MSQINSLLMQALSEIFIEKMEIPFDFFITVTKAQSARDLKSAKIYLSVLPFNKSKEGMAWIINRRKIIQEYLGKQINLKYTPKLTFLHDDSEENASRIYEIMDK